METAHYELQWPKEHLFVSCFAHEIMNYRYHWHADQYELNILLCGSQEFCRGTESFQLRENDVLLIPPGTWHASFGQQANTRALVLHFSSVAFKPFVKKGYVYHFPACQSTEADQNDMRYSRIRFYASQVYYAAQQNGPYAQLKAKASLELLLATLCEYFEPQTVKALPEQDAQRQETFRRLLTYIEENYAEKLSLEDMANFSQYNRTYLSTLFKGTIGINFYEYLTRVRFQHALYELAATNKNLTEIAIDNGFSDLKSMNAKFRDILHRTPTEYRAQLSPDRIIDEIDKRSFIAREDPFLQRKVIEYLRLPIQPVQSAP